MSVRPSLPTLAGIVLLASLTGCHKNRPSESPASMGAADGSSRGPTQGKAAVGSTGVYIDNDVAVACGVPQPKSHFEYDSANIRDTDMATLGAIAKCMREGNLQGRSVEVIGRTDARGPSEYNRQLGKSRAEAVTELLSEKGVEKGKIITRSAGEARAKGTDEEGFASDRRVDIRLVMEGERGKAAPRP